MHVFREHEYLIKPIAICLTIVFVVSFSVYGWIKFNQLKICSSISNEQIRSECVKNVR